MAVELESERCEDTDDIEMDGYVFTDGCGHISTKLARLLVQRRNIVFRNKKYTTQPSRGITGIL
jgi:hypothetical protein